MANTSGIYSVHYDDIFPSILRKFMAEHPVTHERITQKMLGEAVGVRPQSISLYANGETQPAPDVLLRIAEYFGTSVDYMLTGVRTENKPIHEMLGLSETTCEGLRLVKEGYFEDYPLMLPLLDMILSDKDFYLALGQAAEAAYWKSLVKDNQDMADFWVWKGAQALERYFINALSIDIGRAYEQRANYEKAARTNHRAREKTHHALLCLQRTGDLCRACQARHEPG